mmetsp:Transcript_75801/g.203004  ORF Transcript_75801/g.203004 Transcript_75801/m.203004 type:complete len:290 (-) Transcript_75801:588-1457(-)
MSTHTHTHLLHFLRKADNTAMSTTPNEFSMIRVTPRWLVCCKSDTNNWTRSSSPRAKHCGARRRVVPHLCPVRPRIHRLLGLERLRAARKRQQLQRGRRAGGDGRELADGSPRFRPEGRRRRRGGGPHVRGRERRVGGVLGLEPVRAARGRRHGERQHPDGRGPGARPRRPGHRRRVAPHLHALHRRLRRLLGPQRGSPAGHRERVQRRRRSRGDGGEPAGGEPWHRPHRQGPGRRRQAHVRLAQRRRRRVLGLEHLRAGRYRRHHQRPRRRRGWGDGRQPAGSGLRFW